MADAYEEGLKVGGGNTADRKGDWMQTYTGERFYPLDPRANEVHVMDIAHALSMIVRFGGHIKKFYSVAEHSVIVSHLVPPEHAFDALLHDATEAYCMDVPRPLKRYLPEYCEIEKRIWTAVAERFGLAPEMHESIKWADGEALLAEADELLVHGRRDWLFTSERSAQVEVHALAPAEAKDAFLTRFYELAQPRFF